MAIQTLTVAKRVKGARVTARTPNPSALPLARKQLDVICRQYWPSVPLSQLFAAVRPFAEPIQEDGSPWEGIVAGREGRANIELEGSQQMLHIQWYKMPSGKFEVNAYIS